MLPVGTERVEVRTELVELKYEYSGLTPVVVVQTEFIPFFIEQVLTDSNDGVSQGDDITSPIDIVPIDINKEVESVKGVFLYGI